VDERLLIDLLGKDPEVLALGRLDDIEAFVADVENWLSRSGR
jgi:hypothetical protein